MCIRGQCITMRMLVKLTSHDSTEAGEDVLTQVYLRGSFAKATCAYAYSLLGILVVDVEYINLEEQAQQRADTKNKDF